MGDLIPLRPTKMRQRSGFPYAGLPMRNDALKGSKLNQIPLTGFEDYYLVTKETHELLVTKETSEQLKIVETPAFVLTATGEILTTKETHEPLILK